MDIAIAPGRLAGRIAAVPSKSDAHRYLICSALAGGTSRLHGFGLSEDIQVTLEAIRALGVSARQDGGVLSVEGGLPIPKEVEIHCGDSASSLRFLLPVAAALGVAARFTGSRQLARRPLAPLADELVRHGAAIKPDGERAMLVTGRLKAGQYRLPGNVSSQYISGLLLALPLLEGDSDLGLTTPMESRPYVEMTIGVLARHGIRIEQSRAGFRIGGRQRYRPVDHTLEGDYTAAANWLCANALGSGITVENLPTDTWQGDRTILAILTSMGAKPGSDGESRLIGATIDASQIPDLMPVLAATAAFAEGVTVIAGAGRLRLKESDRLAVMAKGLTAIGAAVTEYRDKLVIHGRATLPGGVTVDCCGDHRIAMAMAVAALRCKQPVTLLGAECVNKSYPEFFRDFRELGGIHHVL